MELINCDGSLSALVSATSCTIPVSILTNAPFNLTWGSSVYAKVIATNMYGDSPVSAIGNGAVIITYPSAPLNLTEIITVRTATTLGLQWN